MTITEITAKDFRCFREVEARLAPLTLLVGENSAGKTSFLALVRALLDLGYRARTPNFREPPYDLGAFRDIAHRPHGGESQAQEFSGSFAAAPPHQGHADLEQHRFRATFTEEAAFATPSLREYSSGDTVFRATAGGFSFETSRGSWSREITGALARVWKTDGSFVPRGSCCTSGAPAAMTKVMGPCGRSA